ncbi:MAG: hypothetical protein WA453_00905, partial [Methyloceanibacter sp.]
AKTLAKPADSKPVVEAASNGTPAESAGRQRPRPPKWLPLPQPKVLQLPKPPYVVYVRPHRGGLNSSYRRAYHHCD